MTGTRDPAEATPCALGGFYTVRWFLVSHHTDSAAIRASLTRSSKAVLILGVAICDEMSCLPGLARRRPEDGQSCPSVGQILKTWGSTLFPFMTWIRLLDAEALRADIIAGLTVGVMVIPQSMSYANIAGAPLSPESQPSPATDCLSGPVTRCSAFAMPLSCESRKKSG